MRNAFLIVLAIAATAGAQSVKAPRPRQDASPAPKERTQSDMDAIALACAAPKPLVQIDEAKRIALAVRHQSQIALVRFESEYAFPNETLPERRKAYTTNQVWDPDNLVPTNDKIRVRGTFTQLLALKGEKIVWGNINKTVAVRGPDQWGRGEDAAYDRLMGLVGTAYRGEPGLFLAVTTEATSDPLACDFIGPISILDYKQLPEMIETLKKAPFNMISQESAEELLRSPNPWMRMLALAKLEDLRLLKPKHVGTAIRFSMTDEEAYGFTWLMLGKMTFLSRDTTVAELANESIAAEAAPFLQEVVLRQVVVGLEKTRTAANPGYLPELKKAIKEYLPTAEKDTSRKSIVLLLKRILEFEPQYK